MDQKWWTVIGIVLAAGLVTTGVFLPAQSDWFVGAAGVALGALGIPTPAKRPQ